MPLSRRKLMQATAATALLAGVGCADGRPSPVPANTGVPATATAPGSPRQPPAAKALALPEQVEHGPRTGRKVALTFHGQGTPDLAEAVLTAAEKAGAHITVLAVGTWLDAYPRMARRVLDDGHELGNHTQTHGDIGAMPAAEAAAEIEECAKRLERLTGSRGRWFRPSRTRLATPEVVRLARRAGYPHLLSYDVDPLDYTDPGADAVRAAVAREAGPGSVVSLHLGHPGTAAALPGILDDLHRRGLRAVTTSELVS